MPHIVSADHSSSTMTSTPKLAKMAVPLPDTTTTFCFLVMPYTVAPPPSCGKCIIPNPRAETLAGFTVPAQAGTAAAKAADNDTIWYQMIFEYASEGAYEDNEFRASLLVYEELEEDDTDCDLDWLPDTDRTCRIVVTGEGFHGDGILREHIYVGGLEIPTLDSPCTFAGHVRFLTWYADLRCGKKAKREVTMHFDLLYFDDDGR